MRSLLDFNSDDFGALLQNKVQLSCAAVLPIMKLISSCGELLRYIILRQCAQKLIVTAGENCIP